jgi:hypothetical protein
MEKIPTTPLFTSFLKNLEVADHIQNSKKNIHVNELTGNIYFFYEKIRNAVEYREQHLFRRSAIERLISRKVFINEDALHGLGEQILKELINTRYLGNDTIPTSMADEINTILSKYHSIYKSLKNIPEKSAKKYLSDFLVMAACEIEAKIWPYQEEEAYLNFVYNSFLDDISISSTINETIACTSVYLAVHRSLWKSDLPTIEYYLFKNSFPEWRTNKFNSDDVAKSYIAFKKQLEATQKSEIFPQIQKIIRKNIAPYKIVKIALLKRNMANQVGYKDIFLKQTNQVLIDEYNTVKTKTNQKIIQSIIYIFLTKVFLAFIIELPYDVIVEGHIKYIPLAINLLFPPAFMFFIGSLISSPSSNNTKAILKKIEAIIYTGFEKPEFQIGGKKRKSHPIFFLLYLLTLAGSFTLVIYLLLLLDFNIVNGLVFFIFFSTVSFFGYRVSQGAKELVLVENKKTFKEVLLDFLTLPFIKTGQWLSDKYSKINVFVFILDYIIELPLKSFLNIFEEWSSFINKKKEDLLDK